MRILLKILYALIGLIVLIAIVGFFLPRDYKVSRSVVIAAPPEKIYPMIAETRNWPKWTVWNQRDPAMKIEYSGAASGVGAKWSWQSKTEGNGAMELTAADVKSGITYQLEFADFGMRSTGVMAFSPQGAGTRVTWTNEGQMGSNPLQRYFGLMMDNFVGKDFQAGLDKLKSVAEKPQ
jgi:uncharacterized protein YndB with AHSA1/START domain